MKKNFIYTVTFLLCGAFMFSSCEDMLNVDSDRVEYEFGDWELNDSVYSVLGILKAVQGVADRQVVLNEVRADLVSVVEENAVVDIQEISRSVFNVETNKYLAVKDYYSIINNCNIFLARVDTTLTKNNVKLMLPEFVAVKSVRAWTYLQLAINYGRAPYYTEPILTHSDAEKVMNRPMLTRDEIIAKLIEDILPYENPALYPMPVWAYESPIFEFLGQSGATVQPKKFFYPIRMLLGDLYLWRGAPGDYKKAAQCYYDLLVGSGTNSADLRYKDNAYSIKYLLEGGEAVNNNYSKLFAAEKFKDNLSNFLTVVLFANSSLEGTMSELASVFAPQGERCTSQVVASNGAMSLAERQVYCFTTEKEDIEYGDAYEVRGDLRLHALTFSQSTNNDMGTELELNNLIAKHNLDKATSIDLLFKKYNPTERTLSVTLLRPELAYLRFAEALMGMARENYDGAMELAMTVLKDGVKTNYPLYKDAHYLYETDTDELGNLVTKKILDPDNPPTDVVEFNFDYTQFEENSGIHSRGSGDSEKNKYYALSDTCVARYLGLIEKQGDIEVFTRELTKEDSMLYVSELILDEMALEFAWEGTRFGDLVRVSKALDDTDVLALRIAGRDKNNTVSHRNPAFDYDAEVREDMSNEANWYMPFPDNPIEPTPVPSIPSEGENEGGENGDNEDNTGDDNGATEEGSTEESGNENSENA